MSKIIAYALLGLLIGAGIEGAGKYIGKGISQIKITIVKGGVE